MQNNKYNSYRNDHRDKNEIKWETIFEPRWISENLMQKSNQYSDAVEFADKFAEEIAKTLSTNQIRNFFGEVRRIEMKGIENEKTAFLLLRPKLSYAVKRNENKGAKQFKEVILKAHDIVMKAGNDAEFVKRFKNFVDFLESVLAYHKVHGGK